MLQNKWLIQILLKNYYLNTAEKFWGEIHALQMNSSLLHSGKIPFSRQTGCLGLNWVNTQGLPIFHIQCVRPIYLSLYLEPSKVYFLFVFWNPRTPASNWTQYIQYSLWYQAVPQTAPGSAFSAYVMMCLSTHGNFPVSTKGENILPQHQRLHLK